MVVYYFPTKDHLVGEVLASMGEALKQTLAPAFTTAAADHRAILRAGWPILARSETDPVFALFFEASGLAAAGQEPYRRVVRHLVEEWIEWVARLLTGPSARRRVEAETTVALIDGLLLLRHLAGPAAADRAARQLSRER